MYDIIAISGKSGCGNTTVSTLVAKKLNYKLINYTFRQLAEKYKMSFEDLLAISENDYKYDKELDNEQIKLTESGNCVLGSRLAIWLLKEKAFTVYLDANIEKRINNIQKRENTSFEKLYNFTLQRDENDTKRYMKLYGINNNEFKFANLIINVNTLSLDDIVDQIICCFNIWKNK